MLVRAEVFIQYPDFVDEDYEITENSENDAIWDAMHRLARNLQHFRGIVKIRMPDSPEPDVTGHILLAPKKSHYEPAVPTFTCLAQKPKPKKRKRRRRRRKKSKKAHSEV